MPILTADNLETRSRQARVAIDGCTVLPASTEELRVRKASRVKPDAVRAVAFIYGPVAHALRATSYGPHFALGVSDDEAYSSFASLGSAGLRSIEQILTDLQEEFPATAGFDIVFTTIPAAGETWPAGLKSDGHLRECHAKARQTARDEGLRHVWYAR
jgi:hypothetical protein